MEASIGTALREERLRRKLTVEDVARATKIPRERIVDLEADDYARFSGLAYARSFLLLYAKYLGVESSKYHLIDVGSPVVATDYQYLQSDAGVTSLRFGPRADQPQPRRWRWLVVLAIFAAAIAVGVATALLVIDWNRLPSVDQLLKMREEASAPRSEEDENSGSEEPMPTPSPAPTPATPGPQERQDDETIEAALDELEGGAPLAIRPSEIEPEAEASATAAPATSSAEEGEPGKVMAAEEPLTPVNSASEVAGPQDDTGGAVAESGVKPSDIAALNPANRKEQEIRIRVTRRTVVTVLRDDETSTPVYNGVLTPSSALTYRGKFFWVKAKDKGALRVTVDGKNIPTAPQANNSSESGVEIQ